jgi:hypothetical protein
MNEVAVAQNSELWWVTQADQTCDWKWQSHRKNLYAKEYNLKKYNTQNIPRESELILESDKQRIL